MANTEKLGTKNESAEAKSGNKFVTFFQKHQKLLYRILMGILIVVIICFAIYRFYYIPKVNKASEAIMTPIENFYAALSTNDTAGLKLALEGNDENDGFLTIIDDYKLTETSNTAKYYAALCYLHQGDTENAFEYLLDYDKDDNNVGYMANMLLGDLYDEKGDVENAKKCYEEAIEGESDLVAPTALYKMGKLCEREKNWAEACKMYQQIEENYNSRFLEMGVAKDLERAKIYAQK